jgi:hypothetical protein
MRGSRSQSSAASQNLQTVPFGLCEWFAVVRKTRDVLIRASFPWVLKPNGLPSLSGLDGNFGSHSYNPHINHSLKALEDCSMRTSRRRQCERNPPSSKSEWTEDRTFRTLKVRAALGLGLRDCVACCTQSSPVFREPIGLPDFGDRVCAGIRGQGEDGERLLTPGGALRIEPHDPSIPSTTSLSSCQQYAERTDAFCWFTMFHTPPKHIVCCQCGGDLSPVCCLLFAVHDAILVNVDVG